MEAVKVFDCAEQSRENWLAARRGGIGGSDAAAVLGLSPWRSPLSVYLDKIGAAQDDKETIAMELGKELEPFLRRKFVAWMKKEEGHDIEVREEFAMLQHPDYPWMLGNIDGKFVHPGKGLCGLELKTANEFSRTDWEADGLPDAYYVQVQHYMAVTGLDTFYVGYLIGNRKFGAKEIPRNHEFIDVMTERLRIFWEDNVLKLVPPAPVGMASDFDALKALYPAEAQGKTVELHEYQDIYDEYKALAVEIKELEARQDAIKQVLQAAMGDAETALIGKKKATWKLVERKGYVVEPSISRQFRIW